MSIPKYAGGPAKHAQTQQVQGLVVSADPFTDEGRARTYFKVDPTGDGVEIVHLRAENHATNATWLLTEENMFLLDGSGAILMNAHDQRVKGNFAAADAVGVTGALLISPALLVAGGKLASDAMVVQKNFVDREWHNQTLSPGQSAQGFVYFNLGNKTNWNQAMSLRFDCVNINNQLTNVITLPLAYEK